MGPCRIHAHGQLKQGPFFEAFKEYYKRMKYPPHLTEHVIKGGGGQLKVFESQAILKVVRPHDALIVLDERGKTFSTQDLYSLLNVIYEKHLIPCFAIGGADGHDVVLREHAYKVISMGTMTWPHMMVRVMLMEQLYRIQQIHLAHPYHRL